VRFEGERGKQMWMLKGLVVGSILFVAFSVVYLRTFTGPIRQNAAISLDVLTFNTIYKPLFWVAFVLTAASCCVWARLLSR
jgi:hypothetical protein